MSDYKKILIAVDLSDDSPYVVDKALAIAKAGAELHMMHVMEPIAVGYAVEVTSIDVEGLHAEASKHARNALLEMGGNLGIPAQRLHHVLGQPAREIRELAKELNADLIVMGGHGKHGLDLLFGSTSSVRDTGRG
ncbi:MAG: universal stress protein, partial [Pseudomonadota bacterium]|nr:universal stress protein [Pseudomonadota bacterium]